MKMVEVSFKKGNYVGSVIHEITDKGTNLSALQYALIITEYGIFRPNRSMELNRKHIAVVYDGYVKSYKLFDDNNAHLLVSAKDIGDYVIGARKVDEEDS